MHPLSRSAAFPEDDLESFSSRLTGIRSIGLFSDSVSSTILHFESILEESWNTSETVMKGRKR